MSTATSTAWAVALESIDRELEAVEVAIATGRDVDLEVLPTAARSALGPLPVELLERAAEVQARMVRLEQSLAFSLQRAKGSLGLVGRFDAARDVPRFLDRRG